MPGKPTLRRSVTPWGSFSWGYSDAGADIFVGLGVVFAAAAGVGQYFVMRGLGDIFGFIAGWAVLLDFTIDITLFAWSCVDYLGQLLPILGSGPHPWAHFALTIGLVAGLCTLNFIGVRESTAFNGFVSGLDIVSETAILTLGFLFAFSPQLLVHTMQTSWPSPMDFMKGISLAIVSFVGLESISQAAEETQRPASIIPRTSTAL